MQPIRRYRRERETRELTMCGGGARCWGPAGRLCIMGLIVAFISRGQSATITNYLQHRWQQFNLSVNVGDTITWVNLQSSPSNYVHSYGGEWDAALASYGTSFSFTFTNSGFFAYRTGLSPAPFVGAVQVRDWSNQPPAVSIIAPVSGSIFSPGWSLLGGMVQASVTNEADIAEVQFFANGNAIGSATSSPYSVRWTNTAYGQYILTAKALDLHGNDSYSDPVSFQIGPDYFIWGARLLATGELFFFYSVGEDGRAQAVVFSDTPNFSSFTTLVLGLADFAGAIVDESVKASQVPTRFYRVGKYGPG